MPMRLPCAYPALLCAVAALVTVTVLDVAGRLVTTLLDRELAAGRHRLEWNGQDADGLAARTGVHFVRVRTGGMVRASKMLPLR